MSTIICRGKRSLFDEYPSTTASFSKKLCSTSPIRSSPPTTTKTPFSNDDNNNNSTHSPSATVSSVADTLDCLQLIFPAMEMKVLDKALEESGDLESTILSLIKNCLGSSADVDNDQNWLFEEPNKRSKQVSHDDVTTSCMKLMYMLCPTQCPSESFVNLFCDNEIIHEGSASIDEELLFGDFFC